MRIFFKTLFFSLVSITCYSQKPPITPKWALGHIVWEDSVNTSISALTLVDAYFKRGIPVNGVIFDSPWSDSYNDFIWDKNRYPNYQEVLNYLKNKDVKVILWLTGATNFKSKDARSQKSANYDYAVSKNYGINNSKPGVWWKGEGIHIDFTNKKAKEWWYTQLDKVFKDGVYGWKVDQAEVWFGDTMNTSIGKLTNQQFRTYYYDAVYDYTVKKNPAGINLSRPYSHQGGFEASVEKMNLGWCGDFSGNWKGLKLQIDNIYRSAEKGYGAPACEVAGYFGERANRQQLARYIQFGAMTAAIINGGENGAFSNHLPWWHGKDIEDIYRFCVVLHEQLTPYMFSTIVDAHLNGGSLIKNISYEQESHEIGNNIFTKAITSANNHVNFKLPENGDWVDFWTGQTLKGGSSISQEYPLERFPLFFKSGSIIPMKIEIGITGIGDASMKGKEVFLINANKELTTYTYHSPKDEGIAYEDIKIVFDGATGNLQVTGTTNKDYVFIIRNTHKVTEVKGSKCWFYNEKEKELQVSGYGKNVNFTIK